MALRQMESKKVRVGDNDFYIKPFPAFKASNLTGELASVLAPLFGAIAPLFAGMDRGTESIMDMDAEKVGEMMANGMFGNINISGDKIETLMKKLLLGGNIVIEYEDENGDPQQEVLDKDLADEVFCGNVQDMFVLCVHVIKLNFNGFFARLANLSGKAKQAAGEKKQRKIL